MNGCCAQHKPSSVVMVTLREQMDGEKSAGHSKANYQPGALLCTVDPVIDCETLF